jgi:succinate dehydrogenase/fumarate reductase cytochrome b subunit
MRDKTMHRIVGFLLGGFVAVAIVVGLMAAIYPFAQEALQGFAAAGGLTPSAS